MSPIQVRVANITDAQANYAEDIAKQLRVIGIRADVDLGHSKINAKVLMSEMAKIPYLLVVGAREMENQSVSVRSRGRKDLGVMPLAEFKDKIKAAYQERRLALTLD